MCHSKHDKISHTKDKYIFIAIRYMQKGMQIRNHRRRQDVSSYSTSLPFVFCPKAFGTGAESFRSNISLCTFIRVDIEII